MAILKTYIRPSLLAKLAMVLLAFLFVFPPVVRVSADETQSASASDVVAQSNPVDAPINSPDNLPVSKASLNNSAAGIDNLSKGGTAKPSSQTLLMSSPAGPGANPKGTTQAQQVILPQPDLTTGALRYDYPITIPPGRNGLQPDLKLLYNNQAGNLDSPFSDGWSVSIPYIQRINKTGTDQLYSQNYYSSSLDGELVNTGTGTYAPKVENGSFMSYAYASNQWLVKDKNGTQYKFGYSSSTRQDNPGDSSQIYKWMLEEVRDTNNNYIKYTYYKDGAQIYPATIVYTGNGTTDGIFEIDFLRASTSDVIKSDTAGFIVATNYRINEIDVKVNSVLARKYVLSYTTGDNASRDLISSITETGYDDSATAATLPTTSFSYQSGSHGWTTTTGWTLPAGISFTDYTSGFDKGVQLVDVNGDGLPDLVQDINTCGTSCGTQKVYINNGSNGWTYDSSWTIPSNMFFIDTSGIDQGTRLVDVNADNLPDFVFSRSGSTPAVYLNNGHGWTLSTTWTYPDYYSPFFIDSGGISLGVVLTDVNGDGLVDMLYDRAGIQNVYINDGSGWTYDSSWTIPVGYYLGDPNANIDRGTRLQDINGDGLPDFIYSVGGGGSAVFINNGHGWTSDTNLSVPTAFSFVDTAGSDNGGRLFDVNGDGLADLITSRSGSQVTYINTGNGWTSDSTWTMPLYQYFTNGSDTGVREADINGDGMLDLAVALSGSTPIIYLNNAKIPDVITRITYPKGGRTDVVYKTTPNYLDGSGNVLNPNLPLAMNTVASVTHNDGTGVTSGMQYQYQSGKFYFNTYLDRQFSGFSQIVQIDSAGNVTKTYYHGGTVTSDTSHGEYSDHISKSGKVYRTEVYDSSGNLYQLTVNKWDKYDQGDGNNFVKLVQTVVYSYDGSASTHNDKAETYTYDNSTGSMTQKVGYGQVTGSNDGTFTDTGTDDFTMAYTYAANSTAHIYIPGDIIVTDHSAAKVKETMYYYDNLAVGSVTIGNLTKQKDWKTGSTYIATIKKTYDGTYGLVTTDTDARSHNTTYSYDSYHLYPTTVTNALSQATGFTYDYSSGLVKQTTDPNSLLFTNVYDGFDRLIEQDQPDLTTPTTSVIKTAYTYTDTSGAVSVKQSNYMDGTNTVDSYTYFDGLSRKIQERKAGESSHEARDFAYNNLGLLQKESLPYFSSGTSKTSPTSTTSLYTNYTYDPMQRVTSDVNAIGTISYAFAQWKSTITDLRGKTKDLTKDAYDNLIQVDEHNSGSTYTTAYTYDYLGDLTKITDALSNVRNFTYDGLGHRLTAQDLHDPADSTFGNYTFTYDDTGNLTQKVDPKSQTVNYTYDDISRPLTEDYTGHTGTEVTYAYDSGTNGTGHLTSITTGSLSQTNTYNPIGLLNSEAKTLNSVVYTTSYDYDRQGHQLNITNPDSSQVKYIYNLVGLINQVQRKETIDSSFIDVVSNFDYSPLEQVTTASYGNGMATTNTYDATQLYRLSTKVTTIASAVHGQDLVYTYDNNGNITQIVDSSGTDSSKTVNYTYDDLNRLLTAAATSVHSGQSTYSETYTYDAISNITSKTGQGNYTYAGNTGSSYTNPHAVTSIDSTNFTYDNNGNMLTKSSVLTNTWDYNNRLTEAVAGSTTDTYTYDPSGERMSSGNGTTTIYYPSKFYNTDGATATKHIFVGSMEVGTVTGTGGSAIAHSTATDQLTSSNIVTNSSDAQEELLDYYPFGSMRLDEKAGSYDDQRKFSGHEYDVDTSLSYMDARYYDAAVGRFLSEDQAFLAVGDSNQINTVTGQSISVYLADPQALNSYSYARNNPLVFTDPDGKSFSSIVGNFVLNTFVPNQVAQVQLGNTAQYLYNSNNIARVALNHPYAAGAVVGVGAGALAYGGAAVATALSANYLGGIGTACIAWCGQAADKASQVINAGAQESQVLVNRGPQNVNFSDHALQRMFQDRGVSMDQAKSVLQNANPFQYFHDGLVKTGYYDSASKIFVGEINSTGKITTVITNVSQNYINNLQKLTK